MLPFLPEKPNPKVLVCAAHCDDVEIGMLGTLVKLKASGAHIRILLLSGSDARKQEQMESLAGLGLAENVHQESFADAAFPAQIDAIKQAIRAEQQSFVPDIVFTHYQGDAHQDHATTANACYNVFRKELILEYEIPKIDVDLGQPNVFIPLTDVEMQAKQNHLMVNFPSQQAKAWYTPDTFRGLARLRGVHCNSPFAEAFYCRKMVLSF